MKNADVTLRICKVGAQRDVFHACFRTVRLIDYRIADGWLLGVCATTFRDCAVQPKEAGTSPLYSIRVSLM